MTKKTSYFKALIQLNKTPFLDLLFPRKCPICGNILKYGENLICNKCDNKLPYNEYPICQKCGKKLSIGIGDLCQDCKRGNHVFTQGRSLFLYDESIKKSIAKYKFDNMRYFADFYSVYMANRFLKLIKMWKIDIISPIPLHYKRKKQRGFDQNKLLAKKLYNNFRLIYDYLEFRDDIVLRSKDTKALKLLNPMQRRLNLLDSFKLNNTSNIQGKNILLVDDIYTTGATIDAVSNVLTKADVGNIYFMCIASPSVNA